MAKPPKKPSIHNRRSGRFAQVQPGNFSQNYPEVVGEVETVKLLHEGYSIARYGDGEFNHCNGRRNVSQFFDEKLSKELRDILAAPNSDKCLVGIPPLRNPDMNKKEFWLKGNRTKNYASHLNPTTTFYSSFITRPDNAPWINNGAFYETIRDLWRDRDVILVTSQTKSLNPELMHDAKSVQLVIGPRQHAYAEIDRIEAEIGLTDKRVFMCLGPTATVLAWRLAHKGVHALDMGHIGCFLDNFESKNPIDVVTMRDITAPSDTDS